MTKKNSSTDVLLKRVRDHIRARPAMYFGCKGSAAIPRMLNEVAVALLQESIHSRSVGLDIRISQDPEAPAQTVALKFSGVNCSALSFQTTHWLDERSLPGQHLIHLLGASERSSIRISTGRSRWRVRVSDQHKPQIRRLTGKASPEITIETQLHRTSFGRMEPAEILRLVGKLRDLSILWPGLAVSFQSLTPDLRFAWCYPAGLQSFITEMDHSRWPLHPDSLHFADAKEDMKVEGYLRFVHAGLPEVRHWVNFQPIQGGAHLEGLGQALTHLFPDADAGCRRVRFVTNPDTDAQVMLPHPFVAAIHVQLKEARFAGPTKDILIGDEVKEFVRRTAMAALPNQWNELRARRT